MLERRLGLEMRRHHGPFRWVAFVHDRALVILVFVAIAFAVEVGWTLVLVRAAILIDDVSHARIIDRAVRYSRSCAVEGSLQYPRTNIRITSCCCQIL